MVKSYNVSLQSNAFSNYIPICGKYDFIDYQKKITESLDKITKSDVINAEDLENTWFPNIACDIFISHSHEDKRLAENLAKWLSDTFRLKAFVDSSIWRHSSLLIRKLNRKYSLNDDGTYDYQKVLNVTNHINMILMTAILKVIDSSKCVFFLNTPNSISSPSDFIEQTTNSPWIYGEIMFSYIIDKNQRTKALDSAELEENQETGKQHLVLEEFNFIANTDIPISSRETGTLNFEKIGKNRNAAGNFGETLVLKYELAQLKKNR